MNPSPISTRSFTSVQQVIDQLGPQLTTNAAASDQTDRFVFENYQLLKSHRMFAGMIPQGLGGAGMSHADMCHFIRKIGHHCGSTALAFSMHQHLVAANVWKCQHNRGGEAVLQKVAKEQTILVSTGAGDWLGSGGKMEKVDGGYTVSADKHFASQSAIGDILVTSAVYASSEAGEQVLHFAVPLKSDGIEILDNWKTMGMRGTGSHTVRLQGVFVPDSAVALARPRNEYHPVWNVVLGVALPLIMSAYVGIAERATELATQKARKGTEASDLLAIQVGELQNLMTNARVLLEDMIGIANNFDFEPKDDIGNAMLIRKTLIAKSCKQVLDKSMEISGGRSFFRSGEMERLFRDIQAGAFHPLPEKRQHHFTGTLALR